MDLDFKALAAGLGAAALMSFGAHAHSHKHHPDGGRPASKQETKAPEAVRPSPGPSASGR